MEFKNFKKDVEAAFNNMIAENLFVANVDKDLLWMGYLLSFEDETIRQDHNCNACKSFIRHYGKVVAIDPQTYKVKTFWDDVHTPGYEKTAQALAKLVKAAGIGDVFIQDVNEFHGCDHNVQLLPDGTTRTWTHLYVTIPNNFKFNKRVHGFDSAAGYRGDVRARAGVFERSISELKLEAVETVIELIEGNNLYRGAEFLKSLEEFRRTLVTAQTLSPQILDRLRESGLTVCICCEFEGVAWLTFSPGLPFDIHGEGYDFEELGLIGTEANLRYFEKVTPNYIDCGTDVDKFINTCLQFK